MRVLGIDPGYERLGMAVIERVSPSDKEVLVYSTCEQTLSSLSFSDRLLELGNAMCLLIDTYEPEVVVMEKLYFANNQKTAMGVAQVIGMLMYIAKRHDLKVYEYTPLQIKVACTGSGTANKKQVISMLPHLIRIDKDIKYDDEYDAIAIGLTHLAHKTFL